MLQRCRSRREVLHQQKTTPDRDRGLGQFCVELQCIGQRIQGHQGLHRPFQSQMIRDRLLPSRGRCMRRAQSTRQSSQTRRRRVVLSIEPLRLVETMPLERGLTSWCAAGQHDAQQWRGDCGPSVPPKVGHHAVHSSRSSAYAARSSNFPLRNCACRKMPSF